MATVRDIYSIIGGDIIDSRDLIKWLDKEYEEDDPDNDPSDVAIADEILRLADEGIEDWEYGAQLIRENYFQEYAQELAEDIGAIDPNASWPLSYIDWEAASHALAQDYTMVEFMGQSYYVR